MNINQIADGLDWNRSRQMQKNAIAEAVSVILENKVSLAQLFAKTSKSSWENYCEVVEKVGCPANYVAIPSLLFLLQDINWPGANKAIEILSSIDRGVILSVLEKTIQRAYNDDDAMWLAGLKLLVNRMGLNSSSFEDINTYSMLQKADF